MNPVIIELSYILSAMLFIVGLKKMGSPASARKGNFLSALGMLVAIIATFLYLPELSRQHYGENIPKIPYDWIAGGIVVGTIVGYLAARLVGMTGMPEMVALLNGFGGLSSLLVGWAVYQLDVSQGMKNPDTLTLITIFLSVLIGGVTFSGSFVAWGKLKEVISGKPIQFFGQQIFNVALLGGAITCCTMLTQNPNSEISSFLFLGAIAISMLLGIFAVIPIGGADMPVVISLMNSYSGLAACAAGFVVRNNILIVSGALVGASGIILTIIMCKAMNRSLSNVLFSGFGSGKGGSGKAIEGEMKGVSPEDAYYVLENASSVVFVPGYGLAVAQAQHVVRELAEILEKNGAEVKYAIHPVAGRMPGHMNVLLAEANVSYDLLYEMDDINPIIETVDVAIVIGANDVVNPAAREDETSPVYGMPIINVDKAKTVYVLKRGRGKGFAGIENALFFGDNTYMLFGDAKSTLQGLVEQFKA